jgi:hypothetical protein
VTDRQYPLTLSPLLLSNVVKMIEEEEIWIILKWILEKLDAVRRQDSSGEDSDQ